MHHPQGKKSLIFCKQLLKEFVFHGGFFLSLRIFIFTSFVKSDSST